MKKFKKQVATLIVLGTCSLAAQQNGLNNTFGLIELGGSLRRHTNVKLQDATPTQFNLAFNGEGLFGVGNTITAATLGGQRALFSHVNTAPATGFTPIYNTIRANYYSSTNCAADVTCLRNDVAADAPGYYLKGEYTTVQGDGRIVIGNDLEVISNATGAGTESYGTQVETFGGLKSWGGHFYAEAPPSIASFAYGVEGIGRGDNEAYGGLFRANGGAYSSGIFAQAVNYYAAANAYNFGVEAQALGATAGTDIANIGVLGQGDDAVIALGVGGYLGAAYQQFLPAVNAAVYGNAIYSSAPTPYAGYFDGDVTINGNGLINGFTIISDRRLKKEVMPITNSKEIISRLQPKSFFYDQQNEIGLKLSEKKDYGIIAQELEEVLPELIREVTKPAVMDRKGNTISQEKKYKTVNYNAFFGILLANAQEQQKQMDEQKREQDQKIDQLLKQLEEQKQLITELQNKTATSTGLNQTTSEISGFSLSQNEPNPFTHETVIKYTLPHNTGSAYMAVYDLSGKQITKFVLDQKGASSVTITSEKLSAGIYIYSIVADGKVMDSKKMIVADK